MTTQLAGVMIEIDPQSISPNPWQTRKTIDPDGISALADSIDRDGLLSPILVRTIRRDRYELIAGQRRLMAWRTLVEDGRLDPDARIPAIVREVSDAQMVIDTLTENLVREDVDPIEETRAIARALDMMHELTQDDLAQTLKTSKGNLSNRLRLLQLPEPVLQLVSEGRMGWTTARELLALVGADHVHEDEIALVIEKAVWNKNMTYTGPNVRNAILDVCRSQRWRALEDGVLSYGGLVTAPLFDVDVFKREHAGSVHRIPNGEQGSVILTCAGGAWNAAQRAAKKEQGVVDPPNAARKEWGKVLAQDPVAKRLSISPKQFSGENPLSDYQTEELGTRARQRKTNFGLMEIASGGWQGNGAPRFFPDGECRNTCTHGAEYAPKYEGCRPYLHCSNAECYGHKYAVGLAQFQAKEERRAHHAEARHDKLTRRIRPLLDADPGLARGILHLLVDNSYVSGEPVRPLGYEPGEQDVRYHSSGGIRLARLLGIDDQAIKAAVGSKDFIWRRHHVIDRLSGIEDPAAAATEALAIAIAKNERENTEVLRARIELRKEAERRADEALSARGG